MVIVPRTEAQFPRCTATERCWKRLSLVRGSPVSTTMQCPISKTFVYTTLITDSHSILQRFNRIFARGRGGGGVVELLKTI